MNCMKLLTQAAWGHLGLHYAKKTSGKEPKLADPYGGSTSLISSLKSKVQGKCSGAERAVWVARMSGACRLYPFKPCLPFGLYA